MIVVNPLPYAQINKSVEIRHIIDELVQCCLKLSIRRKCTQLLQEYRCSYILYSVLFKTRYREYGIVFIIDKSFPFRRHNVEIPRKAIWLHSWRIFNAIVPLLTVYFVMPEIINHDCCSCNIDSKSSRHPFHSGVSRRDVLCHKLTNCPPAILT